MKTSGRSALVSRIEKFRAPRRSTENQKKSGICPQAHLDWKSFLEHDLDDRFCQAFTIASNSAGANGRSADSIRDVPRRGGLPFLKQVRDEACPNSTGWFMPTAEGN